MPGASHTEEFNCTPEEFFKIITDYPEYSEFLTEVKKCQVVGEAPGKKLVQFDVALIKTFSYRMWMVETPMTKLEWSLESGDIFKTSTGSWVLRAAGANGVKTKATYTVDATFKVFVPGPIAKALVAVNLPNMMQAYHKRVKTVYGK